MVGAGGRWEWALVSVAVERRLGHMCGCRALRIDQPKGRSGLMSEAEARLDQEGGGNGSFSLSPLREGSVICVDAER